MRTTSHASAPPIDDVTRRRPSPPFDRVPTRFELDPSTAARSVRRLVAGAVASLAFSVGCASAPPPSGTTPVEEANEATEAQTEEDRSRDLARAQRIRELEAQLALARSEAAELRRNGAHPPTETVRIGTDDADDSASLFDEDDSGEWEVPEERLPEPEPEASRNRPTLRLYGERPVAEPPVLGDPSFAPVADVPVRDPSLRLATAPLPTAPDPASPPWVSADVSDTRPPGRHGVDAGREAYERALGFFRERRVQEAEHELRRLLASHPGHGLAPRARYWLAETLYVQRRYDEARRSFEAFVGEAPRAAKVPDALLKIGLCHQRAGDDAAARRAFGRLRAEHPDSVAARTAGRSTDS